MRFGRARFVNDTGADRSIIVPTLPVNAREHSLDGSAQPLSVARERVQRGEARSFRVARDRQHHEQRVPRVHVASAERAGDRERIPVLHPRRTLLRTVGQREQRDLTRRVRLRWRQLQIEQREMARDLGIARIGAERPQLQVERFRDAVP